MPDVKVAAITQKIIEVTLLSYIFGIEFRKCMKGV